MAEMNDDDLEKGELVEVDEDEPEVEDTDDGGAIVRFDNEEQVARNQKHFANIVDDVDVAMLKEAVKDLLDKIEKDKEAA